MITRVSLAKRSECQMACFFFFFNALHLLELPATQALSQRQPGPLRETPRCAQRVVKIVRGEGCPLTSAAASSSLTSAGREEHASRWIFQVSSPSLGIETRHVAI